MWGTAQETPCSQPAELLLRAVTCDSRMTRSAVFRGIEHTVREFDVRRRSLPCERLPARLADFGTHANVLI